MEIMFSCLSHRVTFYHPRYKPLAHTSIIFLLPHFQGKWDPTALGSGWCQPLCSGLMKLAQLWATSICHAFVFSGVLVKVPLDHLLSFLFICESSFRFDFVLYSLPDEGTLLPFSLVLSWALDSVNFWRVESVYSLLYLHLEYSNFLHFEI